jgi:hypothetical protein
MKGNTGIAMNGDHQNNLAESSRGNALVSCLTALPPLKSILGRPPGGAGVHESNGPTVKGDGGSLFANVVFQLDRQKSSVEMILNAMKTFSTPLVKATMLDQMPKIGKCNERFTEVEFTWRASVDVDTFFKTCAPALDAGFAGVALAKTQRPASVPVKESEASGVQYQMLCGNDIKFGEPVEFHSMAAIPVERKKHKWVIAFYRIDRHVLAQLPRPQQKMVVVARFRDSAGSPLLQAILIAIRFRSLEGETCSTREKGIGRIASPWEIPFSYLPLLQPGFMPVSPRPSDEEGVACDTVVVPKEVERPFWSWRRKEFLGASVLDHRSRISLPTSLLPKISKVDLAVEQLPEDRESQ